MLPLHYLRKQILSTLQKRKHCTRHWSLQNLTARKELQDQGQNAKHCLHLLYNSATKWPFMQPVLKYLPLATGTYFGRQPTAFSDTCDYLK